MRFLVVCPASLEASAAIDGPVVLGNEGNLGGSAALRAYRVIHFLFAVALALSSVPACLAAYRLILEALLSVELLFTRRENEFGTAILAYQSLVFEHLVYNPLVYFF